MTEKAKNIYYEIESHFQDGDGSLETYMLFNLCDMLRNASDFLYLFTWEYSNELQEEDEDEKDDDPYNPGLMYEDPQVIFRMKKNTDLLIIVDCRGFMCLSQPEELTDKNCLSCGIYNAYFECEINADNDAAAQKMLEYFTTHFLDKDIKLPNN